MPNWWNDPQRELDYWRNEAEQQRQMVERQAEKRRSDEAAARHERFRAAEERMRNPADWPEAFRNAINLIQGEIHNAKIHWPNELPFWEGYLERVKEAGGVYMEHRAAIDGIYYALLTDMRELVTAELAARFGEDDEVVQALRQNKPDGITRW